MEAKSVTILERQRTGLSNIRDFTLGESQAVSSNILFESTVSLYCLDPENRQAVFVDAPENIDLSQAAFVYQTQFEQAKRLILVPYEQFLELAKNFNPPQKLILLYSTGRCGSTLLHNAFNQINDLTSFSEHDVITQFIHLREGRYHHTPELDQLLQATVMFICKPTPFKTPGLCVFKLRNQCVEIMDWFYRLYPQAIAIFLYRNALDWVRSIYRLASRRGPPPDHVFTTVLHNAGSYLNRDMSHFKMLFEENTQTISATQQITLWWLGVMEGYLYWCNQAIPIKAWRYEDLNDLAQPTLESIFDYCQLPHSDIPRALHAFARDSQENTRLARADKTQGNQLMLSKEQIEQIEAILQKHPIINQADFIVPHSQTVNF
jgi:hypothetical protein